MISYRMIPILLCAVLATVAVSPLTAQEETQAPEADAILIAVNPFGPIIGLYTGSVEFPVASDISVSVEPEYLNFRWSLLSLALDSLDEEYKNADFNIVWAGGRVGLNYFPLGDTHDGLFVGGVVGYARSWLTFEGITVYGNIFQGGVRGGYRAIFGPIALTPYAELNLSRLTLDYSEVYSELGIENDEVLQDVIEESFGFNFRWGISLAIALY